MENTIFIHCSHPKYKCSSDMGKSRSGCCLFHERIKEISPDGVNLYCASFPAGVSTTLNSNSLCSVDEGATVAPLFSVSHYLYLRILGNAVFCLELHSIFYYLHIIIGVFCKIINKQVFTSEKTQNILKKVGQQGAAQS